MSPSREIAMFELNVARCDPADVLDAVAAIAGLAPGGNWVRGGRYAGGIEGVWGPSSIDDLQAGNLFDSVEVACRGSAPKSWLGRLTLEFTGTPALVDGQVTLHDYACHHVNVYLDFYTDPITVEEAWEWLWHSYKQLLALTPLPQPWFLPTSMAGGGLLLDQPGTAATMTHRIPANLFGRTAAKTADIHHYGPLVHLTPETLAVIGDPAHRSAIMPLRTKDLSSSSSQHGMIVQMPWPIEPEHLRSWRDYLSPVIGTGDTPLPEVLDLLNNGLVSPLVPTDVSTMFVAGEDLHHSSFDAFEVVDPTPMAPVRVGSATQHLPRARGSAAIVEERFQRILPQRLHMTRNVVVFANPDALTTPATGLVALSAVKHDRTAICQTDFYAETIVRNAVDQHPDVFAPALLWQRDRTEQRTVKSDSWTLSLLTHNSSTDTAHIVEQVTVSATKTGTLRFSTPATGKPKQAFARLTERAGDLFAGNLADPPDPERWNNIYESRLDIERWIRLGYSSLNQSDHQHNNRIDLAWINSPEHQLVMDALRHQSS